MFLFSFRSQIEHYNIEKANEKLTKIFILNKLL